MSERTQLGPQQPSKTQSPPPSSAKGSQHMEVRLGSTPPSEEICGGFCAPAAGWDRGQTCGPFLKVVTMLTPIQPRHSLLYPLPPHPLLIDTNAGSDMI